MKKILTLFLLTASLGFSATYKVEVKPNVKIQQSEIEKNNLEIERAFFEYKKADVSTALKEIDKQIGEQKNATEAMSFGGITKVFLKKMEFNIKKIEYISPSKANLTIVVRGPIILNSNFNLDEKDKKEISKSFKERTGKSTEYLSKVSEKELLEKWMPKLTDIISERVLEKVNNLKKFDYVFLGHIHKRDEYYPGSLISLGFDEPGEHGFLYGEIFDKNNIDKKIVPVDDKEFIIRDFDISEIYSKEDLIEKINENDSENKFYEINLIGEKNVDNNISMKLINKSIIKIKDNSAIRVKESSDNSMNGIYFKLLKNKYELNEISEDEYREAYQVGLELFK